MKIVYFGSPEESAAVFKNISKIHDVVAVVTNPDSAQKRSSQLLPTPVSKLATDLSIPQYKFKSLLKEKAAECLIAYDADIFVVFSYGHIIPREVFSLPRLGSINLHPSLLPAYRGASPVQSAIIDGVEQSGISVQTISEALDAGDIILQEALNLAGNRNTGEIMMEVVERGSVMIDKAISLLENNHVPLLQTQENVSYCSKITRDSSRIRWDNNSVSIHNLIRALNPKPFAWTTLQGKEIKIIRSCTLDEVSLNQISTGVPGSFVRFQKKRLVVRCAQGAIELLSVHPEGKKLMDAPAFLNGFRESDGLFE